MRRPTAFFLAAALATGGMLGPSDASAQFKPKLPGKLGQVLGGGKEEPSMVPKFNERTIEITDAHVAAMLAGVRRQNDSLEARWAAYSVMHKAYQDSARAYPARKKAWEQSHKEWEACQDREVKPVNEAAAREMQQVQHEATGGDEAAQERQMAALAERIKAAQAKGDMAEVMRIADSIQKGSMKTTEKAMAASDKLQRAAELCGAEPEEPESPSEPVFDRAVLPIERNPQLWATEEQFGIMYDRFEPLLAMEDDGDFNEALKRAFSPSEQEAIGQHAAALRTEMKRQQTLLSRG